MNVFIGCELQECRNREEGATTSACLFLGMRHGRIYDGKAHDLG
jgi:hypothetical protein